MQYQISESDRQFVEAFETCRIDPESFHHREHLRLAYCLLVMGGLEATRVRLKQDLMRFIAHFQADPTKYHETLTVAWILAVQVFMGRSEPTPSWQEFIDRCPILLDKEILFTHYSRERMASEEARLAFIEPDLEPIPGAEEVLGTTATSP